ncbi:MULTISPECIES: PD-(D/E)XK nuclease family protein [unclassified Tenacibaculum]|uniref:PD-(D/E)XK nuclease family protein n=1 Tax=unclassified Tenacibaculum TaxID=2635139 RepID=UPI001F255DD3|nr:MULTISPECIES: PD-(D/E)XK nuclease family protein [unclassified Tenacibaculum]MCF2874038.1 PD-(D/E)XK nuclease family protein [Tenacibaculum sp. Cn5-1]MCF2934619.1 PD-(D/E)XK nuclease family protein [Tenacibaculum sp. Cn5-34]MCG7510829.1 PD-(D/E)XK nuclease family protein [Tenacibaculum sp. Cn5-46]
MNKSKLPLFYNYKEEGTDSGYETVQDFILSWTLRCSVESNSSIDKQLHYYSKRVLLAMIFGFNDLEDNLNYKLKKIDSEIIVKTVKTKRQWNLIDLLVEIELEINGNKEFFILNIENKWYSSIREGQLEKYKKDIEEKYKNSDYKLINLIVFCDYEKLNYKIKEDCKKLGYKIIVIEDLFEIAEMKKNRLTGNYLFDEYWFRF